MRALALLLAIVLLPVLASGEAGAHASLVRAEPADGAILDEAPARLVLTFNEPVSPTVLKLFGPDGASTPLTDTGTAGDAIEIATPVGLARGTHVLSWRVVSLDGHPVAGSIVFSVGTQTSRTPPDAATTDPALRAAIWIARLALYVALFIGVGGVFFVSVLVPDRSLPGGGERLVSAACGWGLIVAPLAFGLQGLDLLGLPLAGISRFEAWQAAAASSFLWLAALAEFAFATALLATRLPARGASIFASVALLGIGLALASSGHASTAPPELLSRPMVFIHVVAIAFWIGALYPLAVLARAGGPPLEAALRRFSTAIPFALGPLIISGIVLAVLQVREPSALLSTPYGWILDGKMVAVFGLVGLGAFNRYRLTHRIAAGELSASRKFIHSVGGEIVLALVIFGLVASWRFTPPPRTISTIAATAPINLHLHGETATAMVDVEPGRAGSVVFTITPLAADMGALAAKEVDLRLANPLAGIEPIERQAKRMAEGEWQAAFDLPVAGTWSITLDILVSDFEKRTLHGEMVLPP